MTVLCN